jgi:MFS family permease
MQSVTWLTILGAFVLGMVLALLGSFKLALARRLGIGETRVGGLVSAFNLALIPLMLLSGLLLDELGPRIVLVAGCIIACVALFTITLRSDYRWALGAVLLLGIGAACISVATIVLMPKAFFGQDSHLAASLNLGNVFVALGALIIPTLAEVLLVGLGFQRTLRLLAIFVLVPAVAALFIDVGRYSERADLANVMSRIDFWLAAAVFALYMPVENFLSTWSTTMLTNLGYREHRAAWLLSGFWLMLLSGRVFTAYLLILNRNSESLEPWLLVILALGVAVALGNLAGVVTRQRAALGLLLLGFLLGPIYPTLVAILFQDQHFSQDRGTAYGAMFAIGSLGSLVLTPMIGNSAKRNSVQYALRIPLVITLVLMLAALVLALQ